MDGRHAPTGTEWRTNMCITENKLVESYGKANAIGRIPDRQFERLMKDYTEEQSHVEELIKKYTAVIG